MEALQKELEEYLDRYDTIQKEIQDLTKTMNELISMQQKMKELIDTPKKEKSVDDNNNAKNKGLKLMLSSMLKMIKPWFNH